VRNPFQQFLALIPDPALQVGTVIAIDQDVATIELPGGGRIMARGITDGTNLVGERVFVRGGVIEGLAPALPLELIEI
jgi:hypothetical protein